ncbi:putative acetyltransferase [compost metagenome]
MHTTYIVEQVTIHDMAQLAGLFDQYRVWVLNDLYVREDYRKQGIAEQLLVHAKSFAVETNAKGIQLSTAPDNKQAQALYEKQGYVRDDEFYNYFLGLV